jgi:hypothetical protein
MSAEMIPMDATPKRTEKPSCVLAMQWHGYEGGKVATRYTGGDGLVYDLIEGEGWFVSTFLFKEDPKYNGRRVCPRCGSPSEWKATLAEARMITVGCEGDCGGYIMSYGQLSDYPHFREEPISRESGS